LKYNQYGGQVQSERMKKGFEIRLLGEVCEVIAGQSPPSSTYNFEARGLPFFQGKADFGILYPTTRIWCDKPMKIAQANDILISVRAPVGPTNLCETEACIGRGLSAIRAKRGTDFKYVLYYLRAIEPQLSTQGRGSTFSAITQSEIRNLKIPLPPLPIQKQIAAILEKADAAREKRRKASKLTEEFLQSMFLEMFGDPVTNPKGWVPGNFGDMVRETKLGLAKGSSQQGDHLPYFYVKMNNIAGNGILDLDEIVKVDASDAQVADFSLERGDFLFNTRNSRELVGKTALFNGGGTYLFNNNILRVRFKANVRPEFLNQLFQTTWIQNELDKRKSGTTSVFAIYYKDLETLPVLVPPIEEQQKFAALVEKVEALRAKQRESEEELENLFKSLMQRAFRGELVQ
jgi:type I restriction enzyme S subunit